MKKKALLLLMTLLFSVVGFSIYAEDLSKSEQCCEEKVFSEEELIRLQSAVFEKQKQNVAEYEKIYNSDVSFLNKWQQYASNFVRFQREALAEHGIDLCGKDCESFHKQLMEVCTHSEKLRTVTAESNQFILEKAFGLCEFRQLSLEEAREVSLQFVQELSSEEMLVSLQDVIVQLLSENPQPVSVERAINAVMEVIFPAMLRATEKCGFEGEEGFIESQFSMLQYQFDPVINEETERLAEVMAERVTGVVESLQKAGAFGVVEQQAL